MKKSLNFFSSFRTHRINFLLFLFLLISACENKDDNNNETPDYLTDRYFYGMMMNGIARYQMAGQFNSVQHGVPLFYGLFLPSPMIYPGFSTAYTSRAKQDTSYFDALTGFRTYIYTDSQFTLTFRIRFIPCDTSGYPVPETDTCITVHDFAGQFPDNGMNAHNRFTGNSSLTITGFRNWNNPAVNGELLFNGSSESQLEHIFSPDTMILFRSEETTQNVSLKEKDCIPRSGIVSFRMIQDATPDSFFVFPVWNNRPYRGMAYMDFDWQGQMIYQSKGIRWILNGEEYFWKTDCREFPFFPLFRGNVSGVRRE